jgi:hypothetical protein
MAREIRILLLGDGINWAFSNLMFINHPGNTGKSSFVASLLGDSDPIEEVCNETSLANSMLIIKGQAPL